MINLREIRISILYFFNVIVMIFSILFIRKYHLLSGELRNIRIENIIASIIVLFSMFAIIPYLIISISHIVKAVKYKKIYYKEKHYGEWHYSRNEWVSFIINNFKKNNTVEMKSFKIVAIYYSVVVLFAFSLDFLTNVKDRKNMPVYILGALATFLILFMYEILKNIIRMIDHILFTNYSVVLMKSTVIVNGEIFNFNIPLKSEMRKKQIRGGNIEIEYAVPARYSGRTSNKRYLDVADIKKLIIPIPDSKYEEAKKYIEIS